MTSEESTPLRSTTCATVVAALMPLASFAQAVDDIRFLDAQTAHERNHWREAYTGFAALADTGNPRPAPIAWQMWRHGPTLYRTTFSACVDQIPRWEDTVARQETERYLLADGSMQSVVGVGK